MVSEPLIQMTFDANDNRLQFQIVPTFLLGTSSKVLARSRPALVVNASPGIAKRGLESSKGPLVFPGAFFSKIFRRPGR
jgi:hypothetical protein